MTQSFWLAFPIATTLAAQPKLPDISYDPRVSLAFQESLVKDFGFARLMDISYDSPRGGRVNGYTVIPAGAAHPAGIVWQHWGQGDRSSMVPEALNLARRGVASILINSPTNRPDPPQPKTPEDSLAIWLQEAVDLRRAADALLEHYGVPAGPPGTPRMAELFRAIDAEQFIGHAAPAALLLQFARYDRFITGEQAQRYIAAASNPKTVHWYDCGHEFNDA